MENNNNESNTRRFNIRIYLCRCFYVCPTFYKIYRKLDRAHHIFARFAGPEAIFICQACLKHIRQYVTEDKSFFFDETKKMLIQYYIPIGESARHMAIENTI